MINKLKNKVIKYYEILSFCRLQFLTIGFPVLFVFN